MISVGVRVAALSTFCIVLTMSITLAVQGRSFRLISAQSSPALEEVGRILELNPDLSQDEVLQLFRGALRQVVASEEGQEQLAMLLNDYRDAQQWIPLVAALKSLPVALLVSLVGAWLIVIPIRHLSAAAARIAKGDLGARAPLSWGSRAGELATLVGDFNTMAATLEKLERERQNMIADIAHELRTPLAILQGQIDAMREGVRPLNDASLARLDKQTQHLTRLVRDLRTLSLAEAGRLSLDFSVLDTARIVEQVTMSFDERAAEKFINLTFVSRLDEVTRVKADPDRLEQVLSNLVDNALRHTPEGGSVTVSVQKYARQVRLSILDSGPGLSEDALIQLFDRFYRAEKQAHVAANSGLGLSITKALVELHQGTISARNAAQGGAVFHILLPVVPTQVIAPVASV